MGQSLETCGCSDQDLVVHHPTVQVQAEPPSEWRIVSDLDVPFGEENSAPAHLGTPMCVSWKRKCAVRVYRAPVSYGKPGSPMRIDIDDLDGKSTRSGSRPESFDESFSVPESVKSMAAPSGIGTCASGKSFGCSRQAFSGGGHTLDLPTRKSDPLSAELLASRGGGDDLTIGVPFTTTSHSRREFRHHERFQEVGSVVIDDDDGTQKVVKYETWEENKKVEDGLKQETKMKDGEVKDLEDCQEENDQQGEKEDDEGGHEKEEEGESEREIEQETMTTKEKNSDKDWTDFRLRSEVWRENRGRFEKDEQVEESQREKMDEKVESNETDTMGRKEDIPEVELQAVTHEVEAQVCSLSRCSNDCKSDAELPGSPNEAHGLIQELAELREKVMRLRADSEAEYLLWLQGKVGMPDEAITYDTWPVLRRGTTLDRL
eukprot:TRINITY_DN42718_c0_g1_i1.p1 TRINITY_DN42718_c0_g1~~TRINITY_DN42718_c0_g1_i1.p1  ORF type:complete len:432 (-),score=73.16 TRINITY_DN42718_c0_g1_i1:215-1510(-)